MKTSYIQLSRVSTAGDKPDEINIIINNEKAHLRLSMTLQQFGDLITSGSNIEVKVVRWEKAAEAFHGPTHTIVCDTMTKK